MKKTNIDPEKRRKLAQIFYEMRKKSLSKMRQRHAGFMEIVKDYTSFKDFGFVPFKAFIIPILR